MPRVIETVSKAECTPKEDFEGSDRHEGGLRCSVYSGNRATVFDVERLEVDVTSFDECLEGLTMDSGGLIVDFRTGSNAVCRVEEKGEERNLLCGV